MSSRPPRKDAWLPYVIVGGCALLALSIAAFGTLSLVSLGRDTPPDKALQGTTVLIGQPTAQSVTQAASPPFPATLAPFGTAIPLLQVTLQPTRPPGAVSTSRETGRPAQPVATRAPVASARGVGAIYKVASGDTLGRIAAQYGLTVQTLVQANNLSDSDVLKVGQELVIPASDGLMHEVKPGDTVLAIARLYGVSVEDIGKANHLDSSYSLRVGQQLVIPGGTRPSEAQKAPTATSTAASSKPAANPSAATATPQASSAPTAKPTTVSPSPTATATSKPAPTAPPAPTQTAAPASSTPRASLLPSNGN